MDNGEKILPLYLPWGMSSSKEKKNGKETPQTHSHSANITLISEKGKSLGHCHQIFEEGRYFIS